MEVPRDPWDSSKGKVPITRNGYDISPDDPLHDFDNIAIQINSNNMDGFVYDSIKSGINETNPVSMFDDKSAPIINNLAQEFGVFDNWFCSVPGPTDPNRQFAMSGTSLGSIKNFNGTLYSQQSYFDYLVQHNRTFAGYYQDDLWMLGAFEDLINKPENSQHIKELEPHFFDDVAAGNLPHFTWLQPRMSTYNGNVPTWQHPDASVIEGERLIKQIYEALRASPIWESSVLLITYDEHGGFYDHVPVPNAPPPDEHVASNGFTFNTLGVRIPTIAISPYIPAGTIIHNDAFPLEMPSNTSSYDSTSILATTNILLGLTDEKVPPLGDRMAWANTFSGLFHLLPSPRQDCPMTLPELPLMSASLYEEQRLKPLNDHLEGQLIYYCVMNYNHIPLENCEGYPDKIHNQGQASDWLHIESQQFMARLRLKEKEYLSERN